MCPELSSYYFWVPFSWISYLLHNVDLDTHPEASFNFRLGILLSISVSAEFAIRVCLHFRRFSFFIFFVIESRS